jgi:hypothetical protein
MEAEEGTLDSLVVAARVWQLFSASWKWEYVGKDLTLDPFL